MDRNAELFARAERLIPGGVNSPVRAFRSVGGTPVLGVNAPVIIGHGCSTPLAIKNMIREAKSHQLDAAIQAGSAEGMCTMDASLLRLYQQGRITRDTALTYSICYEAMEKRLAALAIL